MIRREVGLTITATAVALLLTGCATMTELPPYDTVRDETNAAIQAIADQLPDTTRVTEGTDKPFHCEEDGVFYTGKLVLFQPDDFDGAAFIEELPEQLGSDFAIRDIGIESETPDAHFVATAHGGATVSVAAGETDGEQWIDITALSRCAEPPAEE